jgi:hypothetical protein
LFTTEEVTLCVQCRIKQAERERNKRKILKAQLSNSWKCVCSERAEKNNQIAATGLEWKFEDAFCDATAPVVFTNQKINFHRKRFRSERVRRESQVERRDKEPAARHTVKVQIARWGKRNREMDGTRERRQNEVSIRYLTRRKAFYICYDQTPCVGEELFSSRRHAVI